MAKQSPVRVVCLARSPSDQPRNRTVQTPGGAKYQVTLMPGTPTLLTGEHEIDAFQREIDCGALNELELSPGAVKQLLAQCADQAATLEISRLRSRVAELEGRLLAVEKSSDSTLVAT